MEVKEENKNCIYYSKCSHEDCATYCPKHSKTMYYINTGFIPRDRLYMTPLVLDETRQDEKAFTVLAEIENDIVNFVTGSGQLYIYSENVGNGKTSWAIRLLLSYIGNDNIWPCKPTNPPLVMFISIPKLMQDLKRSIDTPIEYIESIKDNIENVDLVVWDDIGYKDVTEYELSYLLSWINQRIENGKANIYTSNVSPKELKRVLGERLSSRACECSTIIHLREKDKRALRKHQ